MIQVLDHNYGNGKVSRKKTQKVMQELWARKRAAQIISSTTPLVAKPKPASR